MGNQRFGIVQFLGTNCDRDVWQAVEALEHQPQWLWHRDHFDANSVDAIVIPGGFSYGDYLRAGALAARSPVMASVREAAQKGVPILGICNGFQVLCEAGLLPGVLLRNESLRFVDAWVELEGFAPSSWWSSQGETSQPLRLPVAHGEGRYFVDSETLKSLYDQNQVWWKYKSNPNGSVDDIAGVCSPNGRVAALMPHPERALFDWMGGSDGRSFFFGPQ